MSELHLPSLSGCWNPLKHDMNQVRCQQHLFSNLLCKSQTDWLSDSLSDAGMHRTPLHAFPRTSAVSSLPANALSDDGIGISAENCQIMQQRPTGLCGRPRRDDMRCVPFHSSSDMAPTAAVRSPPLAALSMRRAVAACSAAPALAQ